MLLEGKVAVITGAGSGMATESARVFVREGARVLAADIDLDAATPHRRGGGPAKVCDLLSRRRAPA